MELIEQLQQSRVSTQLLQQLRDQLSQSQDMEPITNPNCFVLVKMPQHVGGRCGRVRGGLPFCSAAGRVYMDHQDCQDTTATPDV
jgi:hypothetical protein